MKQPAIHQHPPHSVWAHRWDPYRKRDEVMFMFDEGLCNTLLRFDSYVPGEYDCWATGCLDAPDDIPLGGTSNVLTIGGWVREEYLTLGREWDSWAQHERASHETALMLKSILAEVE